MQIVKKENLTIISSDEDSFSVFYDAFLIEEKKRQEENIILQVFENINVSKEEFLLFLDIAALKKENGTSFVIVNSDIDVDDFPEDFNIVPTLQEAEDVIEMENIERALGF
ncbi:hypothetical protein [Polaribacter septentrionalilitoris]|uniref:hypothetical protein n=1 Tax=Polaribacter septentrionalilitoris TaxID=2494657 RepID=UPI00135AA937|nr:hypothetical protein [Polaribacter septentrionalilitoris]